MEYFPNIVCEIHVHFSLRPLQLVPELILVTVVYCLFNLMAFHIG